MQDQNLHGVTLTARDADLSQLVAVLHDQRARALDLVASPATYRARDGQVVISGAPPMLGEEGVTDVNGTYTVSTVGVEGLSEKLGIDLRYLRRLHADRPDLFDLNVNGMLHGQAFEVLDDPEPDYPPYGKNLLLRILRGDESGTGVLRAVLSDKYNRVDNLDVLVAALGAVKDTLGEGGGQVTHASLTERNMYVRLEAPGVKALAPLLLHGYNNPFGQESIQRIRQMAQREGMGYEPGSEPVVHAGLKISNSETGDGKFTIAPELQVRICRNGYTIKADALEAVHLGGRQEAGIIQWSEDTNRKALELVASKAKDAVRLYLSEDYVAGKIREWEILCGKPVTDAQATIREVTAKSKFPRDTEAAILACFIAGGQLTAGGVMHAVTAAAQTVSDADLAALMEESAPDVLALAAQIG
jgi:hypothetical protein